MTERIRSLLERVSAAEGSANAPEAELRQRFRSPGNLASLEREIASEIASSLGRAVSKLEAAIRRAQCTLDELELTAHGGESHEALRLRFIEERTLAERRLRDLIIQREAIGFRRHTELYERYVIPRLSGK
jgi:hypothetical protein